MKKISGVPFLIWLLIIAACNPVIDTDEFNSGDADFSTYVAIGNSLTAGFADDALYISGQKYSYANILAIQFKEVGGGDFNIPFMPSETGATWAPELSPFPDGLYNTSSRIVLGKVNNCKGEMVLMPARMSMEADKIFDDNGEGSNLYIGNKTYHNLGVPGITSVQVARRGLGHFTFQNLLSGNFNPFFWRFAYDQVNSSVLSDAVKISPTFFSLWVGNMDILGYAVSGGEGTITNENDFRNALKEIITSLKYGKKQGVIANIPHITSIPFFTTIPFDGLVLTQEQANQLNDHYANDPAIQFNAGRNSFIVSDPSTANGYRKASSQDFILLSTPQDSLQCGNYGKTNPIPQHYVLSAQEANKVRAAVINFNNIIKELATEHDLAYVDMNSYFEQAISGFSYDGIQISAAYISGGVFSLDGVHPNPRGHALIANEFIRSINEHFNASVPFVDVTKYPSVLYP